MSDSASGMQGSNPEHAHYVACLRTVLGELEQSLARLDAVGGSGLSGICARLSDAIERLRTQCLFLENGDIC